MDDSFFMNSIQTVEYRANYGNCFVQLQFSVWFRMGIIFQILSVKIFHDNVSGIILQNTIKYIYNIRVRVVFRHCPGFQHKSIKKIVKITFSAVNNDSLFTGFSESKRRRIQLLNGNIRFKFFIICFINYTESAHTQYFFYFVSS